MKTAQFDIVSENRSITLTFSRVVASNTFARMEFFSRLLHSLRPDENHVWRETSRLEAEISGWPKNINWERTSLLTYTGKVTGTAPFSFEQYAQILEASMSGIIVGETSSYGSTQYRIAIGNESKLVEYRFHHKSRTVAALCVLYDLKAHPRNDLEINIPRKLGSMLWPKEKSEEVQRTYGDPSKTADELRNEGWPRLGDAISMKVFRENIGGQTQQMYQLLKKEQTPDSQMFRTNIPRKWKEDLYKSQNYTCQICLLKYDPDLLEPDHRVPVVFQSDLLSEENYKIKLMTLCRFCNQQKRETTKRLPADYNWTNSEWAFPEKFELEVVRRKIESHIERTGLSREEIIKKLSK